MSDKEVKIIQERHPDTFTKKINELLSQGNWRIVETEMSVTDNQFDAMLIRSEKTFENKITWDGIE